MTPRTVSLPPVDRACQPAARPNLATDGLRRLRQAVASVAARLARRPTNRRLWRLTELPDAVLKDADPALYEARLTWTTRGIGIDPRSGAPF